MAYSDVVEMANDEDLRARCIAAVAQQGEPSPEGWVANNMWHLAASPGWAEDWAYAKDTYTVNLNPNLGQRGDVIDDNQILASVQARINDLATP